MYVTEGFIPTHNTILGMSAHIALGIPVDKTVVLCPAKLRDEARAEYEKYRRMGFEVEMPTYLSYGQLSHQHYIDVLEDLEPELIVADECHMLSNMTSGRGKRFRSYMRGRDERCLFVGMTATVSKRNLTDWDHLALWALWRGAPVPSKRGLLMAMDRATSHEPDVPPDSHDFARIGPFIDAFAGDVDGTLRHRARIAFQRRLKSTPGVIVTEGSSCDQPISVEPIYDVEMPDEIVEGLSNAADLFELPCGAEILDPLRMVSKSRQLTQGFYLRFVWPDGEPDREWLDARREFESRVRSYKKRAKPGRDTRGLVINALEDGEIHFSEWDRWKEQRHKPEPPTEAVWIDEYLVDDAVQRARPGTIIWYSHREIAEKLSERIPTARGGDPVPDGDVIGLSVHSHSTGLNLQHYSHNIVLCPPSSGGTWHQMLGRTHRAGQTEPVTCEYYAHHWTLQNAFAKAVEDATRYVEMEGVENKLFTAT
jgi:hypothetical protein